MRNMLMLVLSAHLGACGVGGVDFADDAGAGGLFDGGAGVSGVTPAVAYAGSPGGAGSLTCEAGRSASCACANGDVGAQVCRADGRAWAACGCEPPAGVAGTGGVSAIGGAAGGPLRGGVGGATAEGGSSAEGGGDSVVGSAGSVGVLQGCEGFTVFGVPPGMFLGIVGVYELAPATATPTENPTSIVCAQLGGAPLYAKCGVVSNIGSAGHLIAVRAAPGKTFKATLTEGDGDCVYGIPVRKP